jgi:S1-C subfamily serine protease
MPRIFWTVLLCLLTLGCASHYPTDAERGATFDPFAQARVGDETLTQFLGRRTAFIISGAEIANVGAEGSTLAIRFKGAKGTKIALAYGHAAAIDPHGYFITAAHCVHDSASYLVFYDGHNVRAAVPRLVARAGRAPTDLDYAIIHVDTTFLDTFDWSDPTTAEGKPVVAVGSTSIAPVSGHIVMNQVCLAGRVNYTVPASDHALRVFHDLPLRPGDSGGSLATFEGKLLGINTDACFPLFGDRYAIAERPDSAWISRAIAEDLTSPHPRSLPLPDTLRDKHAAHLIVSLW